MADRHGTTHGQDPGEDEPSPRTVPAGLRGASSRQRKKLVLHVDLNNTILVSDAVTNQGPVAALKSFLSTVTWGRMDQHGTLRTTLVHTLTFDTFYGVERPKHR